MEPWEKELDPVQRDFLEHPVRRGIADHLAERPGSNKTQIADRLDAPLNTVRHHIGRLEAVEVVETREHPRRRETLCFLDWDAWMWEEPRTRVLFGSSRVSDVAREVTETPGCTAGEIGARLELSRQGVHHHVGTLLENGLVRRRLIGHEFWHYPTAVLERWAWRVWGFDG